MRTPGTLRPLNSPKMRNPDRPHSGARFCLPLAGFALAVCALMSGCATVAYVWEPYAEVTLVASKDLNPDISGRPSPMRVKLYELSSRATLDNLEFESAFDRGETLLGEQLLDHATFVLQPGQTITHRFDLEERSAYIAIVAGYRDLGQARWRQIYKVKSHSHTRKTVSLTAKAVLLGDQTEQSTASESSHSDAETTQPRSL